MGIAGFDQWCINFFLPRQSAAKSRFHLLLPFWAHELAGVMAANCFFDGLRLRLLFLANRTAIEVLHERIMLFRI